MASQHEGNQAENANGQDGKEPALPARLVGQETEGGSGLKVSTQFQNGAT